jgi:tetratricopeptide (TPR) repeat protein
MVTIPVQPILAPEERHERLRRLIYREFLAEPNLYKEAGLDRLPIQLSALVGWPADAVIYRLAGSTFVDEIELSQLKKLLRIHDMELISRTAAAVASEMKRDDVSYPTTIRRALCYAVSEMATHAFAALRAAAIKRPDWAQHHYLYGLLQATMDNNARALRELNFALEREPYDDARQRIRAAINLIEPYVKKDPGI